ncbi:Metallo-dependent hydrolase, partial [Myriangium duriaei CBS 260.36]
MNAQELSRALPKVELHAHLTGSISRQTLHEIWKQKKAAGALPGDADAIDPLTAIPPAARGVNIKTFFPIFSTVIYNLITTPADIVSTTRSVLHSFATDGVVYLELRTTPRASAALTAEEYVALVLDTIAEHNGAQSKLKTKLILTVDRRSSATDAEAVVDLAIKYREQGVVGVDLAGDPERGDVTIFAPAFARAKKASLGLTVHFGETARAGRDEELWALLDMQPDRLGHVIHLSEKVREEVTRRKLGLELCLSCNVLAEMTSGGFKGHHFGSWRGGGCPLALSTDDVGIFESELSHEYEVAMEHFGIDSKEAAKLSRQAASVIFGGEEEEQRI